MNQIPNINQFLEEIDPNRTIDRKKAMGEISSVVLLWAINDAKSKLKEEEQRRIDEILGNKEELGFETIYELFDKVGKKETFLASINENINKVKVDYIKTHIQAMPQDKRDQVFSKFPTLREL